MLMKNRMLWGILCVFLLIGSASFGMFSENSRQGSEPVFSITHQGIELLNPAPDLESEATDGKNCVRLNNFAKNLDPYLFAGRRFDSFSGLYNNRNRYYSPKVGRFISRDSIGFRGGLNLFEYAGNNPVNFNDPFGLFWVFGGWTRYLHTDIDVSQTTTGKTWYGSRSFIWEISRFDYWEYVKEWVPEPPCFEMKQPTFGEYAKFMAISPADVGMIAGMYKSTLLEERAIYAKTFGPYGTIFRGPRLPLPEK